MKSDNKEENVGLISVKQENKKEQSMEKIRSSQNNKDEYKLARN